jgi:CheY-like chemotaxis protein
MVPADTSKGTPAGRDLRVLVVDDNHDAADTLAILLGLWGYDCQVSYDGESALRVAEAYRPDCLFLDINLPGMDGVAVARHLRRHPELGGVKLVALTAYSDPENIQRIRETGFDYHVVKPAAPDQMRRLLAMMGEVVRLAGQTKELAEQNLALAGEAREMLNGVKEELKDVTQEVREHKQELREVRDVAEDRPENREG